MTVSFGEHLNSSSTSGKCVCCLVNQLIMCMCSSFFFVETLDLR